MQLTNHNGAACSPDGFDVQKALAITGHDSRLLRELIHLFLQEFPELLAGLRKAVDVLDAGAVEMYAHSLKGAVSNFGCRLAADAALELETKGRSGKLDGVRQDLGRLEMFLEPLIAELQAFQ